MATVKIAVIFLLFLFSDAARFPDTVDENLVVSGDAPDTSAVALVQPPEKQEARTEPNDTVVLVLRPVGNKETETESSLPLDKKEKATSVSRPELVDSFEHLRPFRLCHPRRHRHRFRGVDVVPLNFGDDVHVTPSRKRGEEEGDSTEEAAKHRVTVTSTTEVAVHEELVNREAAEGDQDAKKESRAQKEEEEAKATPTKSILPESNKEGEDGGRKKKEPKKKKDQEDSDSDSDDDDMEMEKKKKKKEMKKRKRKGGWWKRFWDSWN